MYTIAEPLMTGRACFFVCVFVGLKISTRIVEVSEDKEQTSEETPFLFLKGELWKLYKNQSAILFEKILGKNQQTISKLLKECENTRYYSLAVNITSW